MQPYREALIYDSGVFSSLGREALKGLAIHKVVGWGTEKNEEGDNRDYWLVDPMWGKQFGQEGLMKIERGNGNHYLD